MSVFSLIANASLVVQLVMAGLLALSVLSWALIIQKSLLLKGARRDSEDFERTFWGGADLNRLYEDGNRRQDGSAMERIFQSGFGEFLKLRSKNHGELSDIMDGSRRAMRAAAQRELDALENHNAFLATVGSVSPYVGLFGTVWGIMHAFIGLGNATQATLQTVAPGIAEALIATAIGLFAAIPAVIGYNRFAADVDRLATRFDTFMEEFSNILQRQASR
ncbi:protein TolQ [Crenobacter sp. SG2303]|uniref:Tol-Pal system protein TolQ n=1 Tax=Crenobacter oryzisoli TaxID=3056844 RepID=A0ABT7XLP9_9NEIS|nr:protein TolQ [Crenobacter sp. SG2303]MDN0074719.1 protein TolQ [Crenobacter sp. SG2303]